MYIRTQRKQNYANGVDFYSIIKTTEHITFYITE